jgi:hypothetical protein
MRTTITRTCVTLALAIGTNYLAGCGNGSLVRGTADIEARGQAEQIGALMTVNGSYEDNRCMDPNSASGQMRVGATWSAAISASAGDLPLVVLNDSGCVLDITSLSVMDTQGLIQQAQESAPIVLSNSYMASPVRFQYTDSGTNKLMEFYANAMIAPADFSANFAISVRFSDSAGPLSSIDLNGQWATVASTSIADDNVPQPSDALSFAGVTYQHDAQNHVSAISGTPTFTLGMPTGSPAGQFYVITPGSCPADLTTINATYQSGTQIPVNQAPLVSDFGLTVGTNLSSPVERCMTVANCDSASSICAYQLFDVTFN